MFPHGRQYPLGMFAELQAELNYWILGALSRKHELTNVPHTTDRQGTLSNVNGALFE